MPSLLPPRADHRAGTGLLALALSPLVRRYTATDIPALVPLLRKNLLSTPSTTAVTVTALDWSLSTLRQIDVGADSPDVLLVVDCIYHPTLVRPLLATMSALARPWHTVALVVAELRAEDVLCEFLERWIVLGWRVWSVADGLLGARWGMWVAWREGQVAADGLELQ
jgi:protein N-lysine methyltransferase METTL21D